MNDMMCYRSGCPRSEGRDVKISGGGGLWRGVPCVRKISGDASAGSEI